MGEPPVSRGAFHDSLQDSAVISDTSSGPSGLPGLPCYVKKFLWFINDEIIMLSYFLFSIRDCATIDNG